jgi:glutathione peroxidase
MKKTLVALSLTIGLFSCKEVNKKTVVTDANVTKATEPASDIAKNNAVEKNSYSYPLTSIDGKPFSLKDFAGKKILIVNTASKCGYTPQYEALEALYKKYSDKLVIVGFPANNFGGQEPGTNEEIKDYCKKNYGVSFPLSEKVSVVGEDAAPLFKWLVSKELNGVMDATIKWNFSKFLLDEKGNLLAAFPSSVKPMDDAIVSKL